jgi:nucleotide-binding universal stress UspA family protein
MKILLPLDINLPFEPTISVLSKLTNLSPCQIKLLHVKEVLPAYENLIKTAGTFSDDWSEKLNTKAKQILSEAEKLLSSSCKNISLEIVSGPPAYMIESIAKDENFDMTVLTPGHHSVVEKFFLGSVSSKVVKHGSGTILLCRPNKQNEKKLQNVVIGIDGSTNSKHALNQAAKQFDLSNAKIILIHVADLSDGLKLVSPIEFISAVEQNLLMEGETYLADSHRILNDAGIKNVESVLKVGEPPSEIIALADKVKADLIILGAQGHTAIQHFLIGSVSHRTATHANTSVAIVKPH